MTTKNVSATVLRDAALYYENTQADVYGPESFFICTGAGLPTILH
jgi:hypothetical protein